MSPSYGAGQDDEAPSPEKSSGRYRYRRRAVPGRRAPEGKTSTTTSGDMPRSISETPNEAEPRRGADEALSSVPERGAERTRREAGEDAGTTSGHAFDRQRPTQIRGPLPHGLDPDAGDQPAIPAVAVVGDSENADADEAVMPVTAGAEVGAPPHGRWLRVK